MLSSRSSSYETYTEYCLAGLSPCQPVLTVSHQQATIPSKILKYIVEAQVEAELFGFSRIKLRLKPESLNSGGLAYVGTEKVNLALRVSDRSDILIAIKEAPGVEIKNQELYLQANETWAEVLFDLRGSKDERVKIEIFHPDKIAEIEPVTLTSYFNVSGTSISQATASDTNSDWRNNFEDAKIVQVFSHLEEHNSLTEVQLNQILGSPRKARRFAGNLEQYLTKIPFSVKVEATSNGKRYVKD